MTRDRTRTPCAGRASLSHRSPGKPLCFFFFQSLFLQLSLAPGWASWHIHPWAPVGYFSWVGIPRVEFLEECACGCLKLCPTSLKRLLKVVVVFMPTPGPARAQSPGLWAALLLQGPGCHPLRPALASGALSFSLCTHLSASLLKLTALKTEGVFSLSVWGLEDKITELVGCLPCSLLKGYEHGGV